MKREFVYMQKFEKEWKKLGLTDYELSELEDYLIENPDAGEIVRGTGGLRKVRWSLPNKGKSGGVRILYIDFIFDEIIYMIDLFSKDEKDNLSQEEKNIIKQLIKAIGEELRK